MSSNNNQQPPSFYNPLLMANQQQANSSPSQQFFNPMMANNTGTGAGTGTHQQQQQQTGGFYNPITQQGGNQQVAGFSPPLHQQQAPPSSSNQFFNPMNQVPNNSGIAVPQQFFNPMMMNTSTTTMDYNQQQTNKPSSLAPPPTSLKFDPRDNTSSPQVSGGFSHSPSSFQTQQFTNTTSTPPTIGTNMMMGSNIQDQQHHQQQQHQHTPVDQQPTNTVNLGIPKKVQKASVMPTPANLPLRDHTNMQEYETASLLEHYMLTNSVSSPVTTLGSSSLNNFALGGVNQFAQDNQIGGSSGGGVLGGLFSSSNLPFNTTAIQQGPNTTNITPYFNVPPPPADRRMKITCRGSCTPHRIRPTLYCVPNTKKLIDTSQLMMGAMVQPMASLNPQDQPNYTPQVDFTNYEILRCTRCRAYINPFMKFVENGKKYQCNFCGFTNATPDWYYCPTDVYGVRTDILQRPELSIGDVDFIATRQYYNKTREPKPQTFVYVIDVGQDSIDTGVLKSVVEGLKFSFKTYGPKFKNCNVVFITFAKNVQFYHYRPQSGGSSIKLSHPQVMIVADLQNSFVPLHQESSITFGDIIYGGKQQEEIVNEDYLNEFFNKFYETASKVGERSIENVAGSAMKCAEELLSESGGRILLFTAKIPTMGQGNFTLQPNATESDQERRNPYKLYGTDREKEIFIPELGFWKNLGISCAKKQIGIDIFLFPKTFIETANLASASQTTGGHVYLYHQYSMKRDLERVILDLNRHLERESGFDALFKIRTSSGIGIRRYFGHYLQQQEDSLDLAVIDADSAFGVEFKHDESNLLSASESGNHYIQCALVYTSSSDGKRYLRVQTLKLKTATDFNTLYRRADIGACLALYSRLFVHQVIQNRDTLDTVRDMMCDRLINLLACYRKNCTTNSGSTHLVLPETLKYLPLYFLGLAKSPAFCRYTRVSLDKKIHAFHLLMKFSCAQAINFCYPRLYEIQNLDFTDEVRAMNDDENSEEEYIPVSYNIDGTRFPMPPILPPSSSIISSEGIYLLNDGNESLIWVGKDAPQERIQELFDLDSQDQISLSSTKPVFSLLENNDDELTVPNAPYVNKVKFLIKELHSRGVQHGGICVYRDSNEGLDGSFFIRLVEDKFGSGISSNPVDKSYTDYLIILHNEVKKLM